MRFIRLNLFHKLKRASNFLKGENLGGRIDMLLYFWEYQNQCWYVDKLVKDLGERKGMI
jgi:hypothetical protein